MKTLKIIKVFSYFVGILGVTSVLLDNIIYKEQLFNVSQIALFVAFIAVGIVSSLFIHYNLPLFIMKDGKNYSTEGGIESHGDFRTD